MIKQNKSFVFKSFICLSICLITYSGVFAANSAKDNQNYLIVVKNLSKKLQNDLADQSAVVKLTNVKQYKISRYQIAVKGDGVCVSTVQKKQLPIRFDVKMDVAKQTVSNIEYDFVSSSNVPEFAPTSTEEILMKELMKQISKDYKTDNIVIAIDGFEDVSKLSSKKEFTGVGEVRIGDFVWNKIKFDVVLDDKSVNEIIYKVEK